LARDGNGSLRLRNAPTARSAGETVMLRRSPDGLPSKALQAFHDSVRARQLREGKPA
jgi:hypothetical protein